MKRSGLMAWLLVATFCGGQSVEPERLILTYKEYAKIKHDEPYVLEFEVGKGALLLYGGRHVFDSADPQVSDVQKEWEKFKPDVAYNEGGNPPTASTLKSAVERYGDGGLVRFLAGQDAVPVATFEPREADEIRALRKRYSAEQLVVFYALRGYLTFRQTKHEQTPEQYMNGSLTRASWKDNGLADAPRTVEELQAACGRLFVGLKDWREVPADWFDPTKEGQYTNDLSNESGFIRDKHIFAVLTKRALRGDRVFSLIGASHVPVQEPALVALLGPPVRKRNGKLTTTGR